MVDKTEERIRRKAYELWEAEGRPENQGDRHWVQAREIIALEDSEGTTRIPLAESGVDGTVEPAIAHENQGEFPTLTDQGGNRAGRELGAAPETADPRPKRARAGATAAGRSAAPTDSAGRDLTGDDGRAPVRAPRRGSAKSEADEPAAARRGRAGKTPASSGKKG